MKQIFLILFLGIVLISCVSESSSGGINPLPNFDAMWDYDNPGETEELFLGFLKFVKNSAESSYDQNYHVELLTQIARAQGLQKKFLIAENTLDIADSLITEKTKVGEIRYLLEKGRLLNSSGKKEESVPVFLEAYNFGTLNKIDNYTLDAIHMLGIVQPLSEQLQWNKKALIIAENSDDVKSKAWLGALYNNIGWNYHDNKNYEKAMEHFQKGLEFRKNGNNEKTIRIAKWTVGRCYRSLGDNDKAKEIMLALEKEIEEKKIAKDGYVFEELGELFLLEKSPKSKKYFGLAYDILSKDNWMMENEKDRLARMKNLSK